MAWDATPAGLYRVTGADLSENTHYVHGTETFFCPGGGGLFDPPDATVPYNVITAFDAYDTYAADHVSELASYDLVQIYTVGSLLGGSSGGWTDCASFRAGDPISTADCTSPTITGGPSTELLAPADGTSRPIVNPVQANFEPDVEGLFMRPTALTWAGQDPTNDANRSVWLPSEVIGAIGTIQLHYGFDGGASGYDLEFGTGVRALNVITATDEPVICFV